MLGLRTALRLSRRTAGRSASSAAQQPAARASAPMLLAAGGLATLATTMVRVYLFLLESCISLQVSSMLVESYSDSISIKKTRNLATSSPLQLPNKWRRNSVPTGHVTLSSCLDPRVLVRSPISVNTKYSNNALFMCVCVYRQGNSRPENGRHVGHSAAFHG